MIDVVDVAKDICAMGNLLSGMAGGLGEPASTPPIIEIVPTVLPITTRSIRGLVLGALILAELCAPISTIAPSINKAPVPK